MDFRDTLTALLPPPRDDEPAGLRQDIVDELGDHLACAYNREVLRGAHPTVARQRVLERFGDPAAVACRLWLDAMKGKIMAQRVVIATCLVLMLACLALVGLVWIQSSRAAAQAAAQVTEANRQLAAALAQAQTTNKDMLSKLSEMSEAIRHPRSLDWNPVKFVITDDTPDGPPVAGCSISLYLNDGPQKQMTRRSDAAGVADFGLVNPGEYRFQVSHPGDYPFQVPTNQGRRTLYGSGQLTVGPGSQINQRILCPKSAFEPVPLKFRCEWPADLQNQGLVLDAPFSLVPLEKDGMSWGLNYGIVATIRSVLFGPGAKLREILNSAGLYTWASSTQTLRADILASDLRAINAQTGPLKWEGGTYQLTELIVLRPSATGRQEFEVLVRCYPWTTNGGLYHFQQEPPTLEQLRSEQGMMGGMSGSNIQIPGLQLHKESWSKITTSFDARPDRLNEWTITLPEELIKAAREMLKVDPAARAKPAGPAAAADRK